VDDELDALLGNGGTQVDTLFGETSQASRGIGFALADIARQKQAQRDAQRLQLSAEREQRRIEAEQRSTARQEVQQVGNLEAFDALSSGQNNLTPEQTLVARRLAANNLNQGVNAFRQFSNQNLKNAQDTLPGTTSPPARTPREIADQAFQKALSRQFDLRDPADIAAAQPFVEQFNSDPQVQQRFLDAGLANIGEVSSGLRAFAGGAVDALGNLIDTGETLARTRIAGGTLNALGIGDSPVTDAILNTLPEPGSAGRGAQAFNEFAGLNTRSPEDTLAQQQIQRDIQQGSFTDVLATAFSNPVSVGAPTAGSLILGAGLGKAAALGTAEFLALFGAIETGDNIAETRRTVDARLPDATEQERELLIGAITTGQLTLNTALAALGPEALVSGVPLAGSVVGSRLFNILARTASGTNAEIVSEAGNAAVQVGGQAVAAGQPVGEALAVSEQQITNQGALGVLFGGPAGAVAGAVQPVDTAPPDTSVVTEGDAILGELLGTQEVVDEQTQEVQTPEGQTTEEGQTATTQENVEQPSQQTADIGQPLSELGQQVRATLSGVPATLTPNDQAATVASFGSLVIPADNGQASLIDPATVQSLIAALDPAVTVSIPIDPALDEARLVSPIDTAPSTLLDSARLSVGSNLADRTMDLLSFAKATRQPTPDSLEVSVPIDGSSRATVRYVPKGATSDFLAELALPLDSVSQLNRVPDNKPIRSAAFDLEIRSLNRIASEQNAGVTFARVSRADLIDEATPMLDFLGQVASAFGKRLGVITPDTPTDIQGVVSGRTPDTIFITADTLLGGTQDAPLFVLGHELAESIKLNDSALFNRLKGLAVEYAQGQNNAVDGSRLQGIINTINSADPDQGVADLVGFRLGDEGFWRFLQNRAGSTFRRLAAMLARTKDQIRARLTGSTNKKAADKESLAAFDGALADVLETFRNSPEVQSDNLFFSREDDGSPPDDGDSAPKPTRIKQTNLNGTVETVNLLDGQVVGTEPVIQRSTLPTLGRFFTPKRSNVVTEGTLSKANRLLARQDGVLRRANNVTLPTWNRLIGDFPTLIKNFETFIPDKAPNLAVSMLDSASSPLTRDNVSVYETSTLATARFADDFDRETNPIIENIRQLLRTLGDSPGAAMDFAGELMYVIHAPERNAITWLLSAPLTEAGNDSRTALVQRIRDGQLRGKRGQAVAEFNAIIDDKLQVSKGMTPAEMRAGWIGSGLTDAQAKSLLARKWAGLSDSQRLTVKDLLENQNLLVEEQRRYHRESGTFDSTADAMVEFIGFKAYVPLKGRIGKTGKDAQRVDNLFAAGSRSFVADGQALEGRKSFASNPLIQLMVDTQRASQERAVQLKISAFLKNHVLSEMSPAFRVDTEGAFDADVSTIETNNVAIRQVDIDTFVRGSQRAGAFIRYLPDENLIAAVKIKTPLVQQAYAPIDMLIKTGNQALDTIVSRASAGTSFLSRTHTTWDASFQITNNVRETINATFTAGGEIGAGAAAGVLARSPGMLKDLPRYLFVRSDKSALAKIVNSNPNIAMIDQFFRLGGRVEFISGLSLQQQARDFKKLGGFTDRKSVRAGKALIRYINDVSELAPRLALFAELVESGQKTPQEAAEIAKNLANFEQAGEFGRFFGAFYMFARPSALGASRALQTIIEGENGLTLMAVLFGLGAAVFSLSAFMGGGEDDDPEGRARGAFDQANRWTREARFYYDPDSDPIRVPFGYGVGAFMAMGAQFAAWSSNRTTTGEFFSNLTEIARDNFSPLPTSGVDLLDKPGQAIVQSVTPSALLGVVNLINNTSGFGNDIVPQWVIDKEDAKAFGVTRSTAGTQYQSLAIELHDSLGLNVHANQLKHFVEYFGAPLGEASNVIFSLLNKREFSARRDIPFVGGFIGSASDSRISAFHEAREAVENLRSFRNQLERIDRAKPAGQKDRIERFERENPNYEVKRQALLKYNREAKVFQREFNAVSVQDPDTITPEQRTRRMKALDKKILPIRVEFLQVIQELQN
jgi:hypothetical protein